METTMKFSTELVSLIKEKPELSSLDDEFVARLLAKQSILIDEKYQTFAQFKKSAVCKQLVSRVRKQLREIYGVFIKQPLSKVKDKPVEIILQSHQSTHERFDHLQLVYELLFDKLFASGLSKQFTLLDIACGFMPFSLAYFPQRPTQYIACDLSSEDMVCIQNFFSLTNQAGEAKAIDVLSDEFEVWAKKLSVDICFLFKALDSFEQRKRHSSKHILSVIPAKFFVVSFALKTIGGKTPIAATKRTWFEKFCIKQGWSFETIQIPNEIFYIVRAS